MAYLDETVWSVLLEIAESEPKCENWIPKPKECTRAVKNRYKNVYKLLQVAYELRDILHEVITLLDYGLFYDSEVLSFQNDNLFSLKHATKLVSHFYTLHKPFDFQVKSNITLRCLYADASCRAKERNIRDVISESVNYYFKNFTVKNIDTVIIKERAAKVEKCLQTEFMKIMKQIVLLAVSGNYLPITDCELEQCWFSYFITPFEYGSFAPVKLLQRIVDITERHNDYYL